EVLESNAKAMDELSTKAHETLITIDELHVKSKDKDEESGGRQMREILQSANSEYLSSAKSMGEPDFYDGLRESSPDDSGDWGANHGATPTPAGRPQETSPSQPTHTEPASVDPNPVHRPAPGNDGPQLQGPAPAPAAPAPT